MLASSFQFCDLKLALFDSPTFPVWVSSESVCGFFAASGCDCHVVPFCEHLNSITDHRATQQASSCIDTSCRDTIDAMTPPQSRKAPPVNTLPGLFKKHPIRSNQEWAPEWGISRERVRQLRVELGLPPFSKIARQIRAEQRQLRAAEETARRSRLSVRVCPVDGSLVPVSRDLTCSSECAEVYRSTFVHRVQR